MQRMYVTPHYDPVFVEPSLKEYETQVTKILTNLTNRCSVKISFSNVRFYWALENYCWINKSINMKPHNFLIAFNCVVKTNDLYIFSLVSV